MEPEIDTSTKGAPVLTPETFDTFEAVLLGRASDATRSAALVASGNCPEKAGLMLEGAAAVYTALAPYHRKRIDVAMPVAGAERLENLILSARANLARLNDHPTGILRPIVGQLDEALALLAAARAEGSR